VSSSQRARNRCRERLEALADATRDADEARLTAIAELRRVVGFERWCWPLSDPDSALSVAGIGEVDFWPSLARLVALEHGGDLTSKPRLLAGDRPSVALSTATGGDLARSRRWRECLSPYGIGDELMTLCRDRHGCWGSVELMRAGTDPPFDDDDQRLLGELAPTLGALLRRSASVRPAADLSDAEPIPPATVILSSGLAATSWTASFGTWLGELPASAPDPASLPPAVYEIAARALDPAHDAIGLPNRVRIRTASGRWSVIEGAPLEGAEHGHVAITIRAATGDEVFDVLCKIHDLTRRERHLSSLMLHGLSTEQLARALHISPYTVKDHLKAIFDKTGVRSRRELISHLAGRSAALQASSSSA
jgi:DNA-binding CsgD family transcriptional regulator